jgi:hypothetical protein
MKLVHRIPKSTFELYDLEADLSERNNLFIDEDGNFSEMMKQMHTSLLETGPCPMAKVG